MSDKKSKYYTPEEERLNIITHAAGFCLSIAALVSLIIRALKAENTLVLASFIVFGFSLVLLYGASTLYHCAKNKNFRKYMHIADHSAIYLLIAGTYTPYTLITLHGAVGWTIFSIVWSFAVAGVILKLFFTGRFSILSTVIYVIMGWIIIFAVKPLFANLSLPGLLWLFAGGIAYTAGAVLYSFDKIRYNHALFHLLVLTGSLSHFISVYFYVKQV